jgi:hypothetical protein
MKSSYGFSRRAPDILAHELATVLSAKSWFDFQALFAVVYSNLRARKGANGGEEMLRLRAYDKLQSLVAAGVVEKNSKQYRGVAPALASFFESAASVNASLAARKQSQAAENSAPVPV